MSVARPNSNASLKKFDYANAFVKCLNSCCVSDPLGATSLTLHDFCSEHDRDVFDTLLKDLNESESKNCNNNYSVLKTFIVEKFSEIEELCREYPFLTEENIQAIQNQFIDELNNADVSEGFNKPSFLSDRIDTLRDHIAKENPSLRNMSSFVEEQAKVFEPKYVIEGLNKYISEATHYNLTRFIALKSLEIEELCDKDEEYEFLTQKDINAIQFELINELNKVNFNVVNEKLRQNPENPLDVLTRYIEQNTLLSNIGSFVKNHVIFFEIQDQIACLNDHLTNENYQPITHENYLVLKTFIFEKFSEIEELCKKYPSLTKQQIKTIQKEFIKELNNADVREGLNKPSHKPRLQTLKEHVAEKNASLQNMSVFVASYASSFKPKYQIDGLHANLSEITHGILKHYIESKYAEIEVLCEDYSLTEENIQTIKNELINELNKVDFEVVNEEISKNRDSLVILTEYIGKNTLLNNMYSFVKNHTNYFVAQGKVTGLKLTESNEITRLVLKTFIIEKFAEIEELSQNYTFLTEKNIATIQNTFFINELNKVDFNDVNEALSKKSDKSCLQILTEHIEQQTSLNNMVAFVEKHANSFKTHEQKICEFLIGEITAIREIVQQYKDKGGEKLFVNDFIGEINGILKKLNERLEGKSNTHIAQVYNHSILHLQNALNQLQKNENKYYNNLMIASDSRKQKSSLQPAIYKAFDHFYTIPTYEKLTGEEEKSFSAGKQKNNLIEKIFQHQTCELLINEIHSIQTMLAPYKKDQNEVSYSIDAISEMLIKLQRKQNSIGTANSNNEDRKNRGLYTTIKVALKNELTSLKAKAQDDAFVLQIEDAIERLKKLPTYKKLDRKLNKEIRKELSSYQDEMDSIQTTKQKFYVQFGSALKSIREIIRGYNNVKNKDSVNDFLAYISKLIAQFENDPESFYRNSLSRHADLKESLFTLRELNISDTSLQNLIIKAQEHVQSFGVLARNVSTMNLEEASFKKISQKLQPKLKKKEPQEGIQISVVETAPRLIKTEKEELCEYWINITNEIIYNVGVYQQNNPSTAIDQFIDDLVKIKVSLQASLKMPGSPMMQLGLDTLHQMQIDLLNNTINALEINDFQQELTDVIRIIRTYLDVQSNLDVSRLPEWLIAPIFSFPNKNQAPSLLVDVNNADEVEAPVENKEVQKTWKQEVYSILIANMLDIHTLLIGYKGSKPFVATAISNIQNLLIDVENYSANISNMEITHLGNRFALAKEIDKNYRLFHCRLINVLTTLQDDEDKYRVDHFPNQKYKSSSLQKIINIAQNSMETVPTNCFQINNQVRDLLIGEINELLFIVNQYKKDLQSELNKFMNNGLINAVISTIDTFLASVKDLSSQIKHQFSSHISLQKDMWDVTRNIYGHFVPLLKEKLAIFTEDVLKNNEFSIQSRNRDVYKEQMSSLQNLTAKLNDRFKNIPNTIASYHGAIKLINKHKPSTLNQKSYEFLISEIEKIKATIDKYQKKDKQSFKGQALISINKLLHKINRQKDDHVNIKIHYDDHIAQLKSILDKLQSNEDKYCEAALFTSWRRNKSTLQGYINTANHRLQQLPQTIHALFDRLEKAELKRIELEKMELEKAELKKQQMVDSPKENKPSTLQTSSSSKVMTNHLKKHKPQSNLNSSEAKSGEKSNKNTNIDKVFKYFRTNKPIPVKCGANAVNRALRNPDRREAEVIVRSLKGLKGSGNGGGNI